MRLQKPHWSLPKRSLQHWGPNSPQTCMAHTLLARDYCVGSGILSAVVFSYHFIDTRVGRCVQQSARCESRYKEEKGVQDDAMIWLVRPLEKRSTGSSIFNQNTKAVHPGSTIILPEYCIIIVSVHS